jgi:hypothetical protein
MMKKTFAIIASFLLPMLAWGQAQITTKKVKISDFTQKVTKVVLSGNELIDIALQDEVTARWRISPYEFCTLEEFDRIKTNGDYYFLLVTRDRFKKDSSPSIQFLTLVKGGKEASEGIGEMLEVVSMPIASAQFPSGREIIFLPAFLNIIQEYTLDAMDKDTDAYGGLGNHTRRIPKSDNLSIVLSKGDLAVDPALLKGIKLGDGVTIASEEETDALMTDEAAGTIISYVVAPFDPQPGAFCYKMLIDTQAHRLYYYKRHRISEKAGAGFLKADLKRISHAR